MTLAPLALFVYNRPDHTKQVISALLKNIEASDTKLFIFSDAARTDMDVESVNKTRDYIKSIKGFISIEIIERSVNLGLARSIIDGVTQLCTKYGRIIVLEDDLEVSPYFLAFMNAALDRYEYETEIAAISGYAFPVNVGAECFFRPLPHSWGWATWQRAWKLMEFDGHVLLSRLDKQNKAHLFNKLGHQPMLTMLRKQVQAKNDSWYVRWAASLHLADKLTLMPAKSLVKNIGIDGSGTHCAYWRFNPYDVALSSETNINKLPNEIKVDHKKEKKLRRYFIKVQVIRYVNFFYRILVFGKYSLKMRKKT